MVKNLKNNDKLSCDKEESSQGPLQFTGPDKSVLANQLIVQTVMACGLPPGLKGKEMAEWAIPKVDLMKDIKPQDGIEGMLAAQMVVTHNVLMECFYRAMVPNQSSLACDQYLKHAAKLLSTYTRQMAALDKHRGKGQQKIRIEHVNVEAGGQAMVGHIETGANQKPRRRAAKRTPKAIPDNPGQTLDMAAAAPEPAKRGKN